MALLHDVARMRLLQKEYFKARREGKSSKECEDILNRSKALEKKVDQGLKEAGIFAENPERQQGRIL